MDYPLCYIMHWPEFQQYEEIPGFWKHAFNISDGNVFSIVVEKQWLDKKIKNKK